MCPPPQTRHSMLHLALQDAKRGSQSVLSRGSLLAELQAKGVLNIIPQVPVPLSRAEL